MQLTGCLPVTLTNIKSKDQQTGVLRSLECDPQFLSNQHRCPRGRR
jgi:hypothetical protein